MSGGNLNTEIGPVPPIADDTRQLAIAGVHRWVPVDGVDEVLDMLGLGRPEDPVLRNIDGSAAAEKRFCGCGKRIMAAHNPKCSACLRKPGERRTPSATGGDS